MFSAVKPKPDDIAFAVDSHWNGNVASRQRIASGYQPCGKSREAVAGHDYDVFCGRAMGTTSAVKSLRTNASGGKRSACRSMLGYLSNPRSRGQRTRSSTPMGVRPVSLSFNVRSVQSIRTPRTSWSPRPLPRLRHGFDLQIGVGATPEPPSPTRRVATAASRPQGAEEFGAAQEVLRDEGGRHGHESRDLRGFLPFWKNLRYP